jgi:hypothetical protein
VVRAALARLDWKALLAKHEKWSFNVVAGELCCEDGRPLTITTVGPDNPNTGKASLFFRRPTGGCEDCPARATCFDSDRPKASKLITFPVSTDVAAALRARLALMRAPIPATTIIPITATGGALDVVDSLFLPSVARKNFTALFVNATIHVEVTQRPKRQRPRLVAASVADRQRRRKSWAENVARYALEDTAVVDVDVKGSKALRAFLGEDSPGRRHRRAAAS